MKLFNSLIILTAVINFAQDVNEDVDLLVSLPSQTLDCSLQFDRDFVASNEEVAAAIEALLEDNASEESGAPRGDKPCDSSEETDEEDAGEETTADEEPILRRALRGRGPGGRRNRDDVTLEAGATRPPRGDKPCDSSDSEEEEEEVADEETDVEENTLLRRTLRGRGRGGRRNRYDVTLEAGATRPPRGDRPCDSSSEESDESDDEETATEETDPVFRRALRGRGRGRRNRNDVTLESGATRTPRGDKPCDDSSSDEETDEEETVAGEETAAEEEPVLRRVLRGRGRGGRRNRNDVTLESGATRPPRDDRPCDSSDETAEENPVLRRLLRGGRGSSESETDQATGESTVEREPCTRRSRGRNNRRNKDTTTEMPEETEGVARRELRGGRRSRRVEATISNGSIEVAGLTGEVVFGAVSEELETMPLTITVGETAFTCDVEIRRGNKVSCQATSEDNFLLRVGCELPADEE